MSEEGVTYSFKDLFDKLDDRLNDGFGRLEHRVDEVRQELGRKADNSRVDALEKRQLDFEIKVDERVKPLENFVLTNSAVSLVKGKGLLFLSSLVVAIISALIYVALSGGVH